ncbi:universal stress protein [Flexivirga oryzae]|uniref:Nucleotide-binding universal stress UspA family protein n=1 Tax=Flexivirga oryzae TaxID=1794944 RepID=A0A839N4S3_9MICO|nr:universal stress protein [Flexivirga oryzae]MBB2892738.1 nucleotide-binding universal stress UspA family protein [Flexivirga oryzae]
MSRLEKPDSDHPSSTAPTARTSHQASIPSRAVVVGIDRSAHSTAALEWAVAEAMCRSLPLHLVHAVGPPPRPDPSDSGGYDESPAGCVTDALRALHDSCAGLPVTWSQPHGAALPVLVRASRVATLVVVGTRGRGALRQVVTGSTAVELIADAHCPVVVVRTRLSDPGDGQAPVIVGLGARESDADALRAAFREAEAHQRPVLAVHATDYGFLERARIERLVSTEQRRHPTVTAKVLVKRGVPADLLVARSARASLLVLGSHGRHEAAGVVLGSVSQAVLRRAECPVLVAREGTLRPFGTVPDLAQTGTTPRDPGTGPTNSP